MQRRLCPTSVLRLKYVVDVGEGGQDLVGGPAPDERARVGVPLIDPGADIFLQRRHTLVEAAV